MTWTELTSATKHNASRAAAADVGMSCSDDGGRFLRRVSIILRERLLSDLPWLRPGCFVRALIGAGEHAGQIRVVPCTGSSNAIVIGKNTGRSQKSGARLLLGAWPGVQKGQHRITIVTFDHGGPELDPWLVIDLPPWALDGKGKVLADPVHPFLPTGSVPPVTGKPRTGASVLVDRVAASAGAGGAIR